MPAPSPSRHAPDTALAGTVRGRLLLLTSGSRGTPDDALAAGASLLLDAAFEGVIAVEGRRRLGIDRRRVVPGPVPRDAATTPLVADVRRRVEAARGDTPWGWCERLAVFAEDAVVAELVADGLARPLPAPWWRIAFRYKALAPTDPAAADAIRAGVRVIGTRRPPAHVDVALASVLHGCDVDEGVLGGRHARRVAGALRAATRELPPACAVIAEALRERRRRVDSIGSWYADD